VRVLVTGAAGFIGFHAAARLLEAGHDVLGADNLNSYYDPKLKHARLAEIARRARTARGSWEFAPCGLERRGQSESLFARGRIDTVVHLAAQAGVRYSIENPHAYTS